MPQSAVVVPNERIDNKIFVIRGRRVMLDRDLATLYGVETRALNQAVKRNQDRFPDDFMFQLTSNELKNWTSQFVISNKERRGLRKSPYAFTENGVAMLSSVLQRQRAIRVNIQIMRAFTKIREFSKTHQDLRRKIEAMDRRFENKFIESDDQFRQIFEAIKKILEPPLQPKRRIGFHP
jgi:hypothetical protein